MYINIYKYIINLINFVTATISFDNVELDNNDDDDDDDNNNNNNNNNNK